MGGNAEMGRWWERLMGKWRDGERGRGGREWGINILPCERRGTINYLRFLMVWHH